MKTITLIFCSFLSSFIFAKTTKTFTAILPENINKIKQYEDTIRIYSDSLINSESEQNRTIASYRIIKVLSKALKIKNAYQYNWNADTSLAMNILTAEDNKFKIFTWFVKTDNEQYHYFGAIQMNSDTLQLFPLTDYSNFTDDQEFVTVDNNNWIGALYYGIKTVKSGKKTYYTFFGWDGKNLTCNRKIMETMVFVNGKPRFGIPIIQLPSNKTVKRLILSYTNDATCTLRYDDFYKKVIFDHLAPNGNSLEGFYGNYLPDGTYETLQWKKGKWLYEENLEYQKRQDGDVPNVQKKEYQKYDTKKSGAK